MYQAAANQTVRGVRVPWKTVPGVTDTRPRHDAYQKPAVAHPPTARGFVPWTYETIGPAQPLKVVETCRIVREPDRRAVGHRQRPGTAATAEQSQRLRWASRRQRRRLSYLYNLTVALAGSEGQRGSLFANYLLAQARANPKIPWSTLVRPEDWARFPLEHLIRFILRADDDLSPGERALQGLLARVFQQRGETLDSGLSSWWSPTDPAKRRRLLELCEPEPPLISATASSALTVALSIDELAAGGAPITGAPRAEYRQGLLARRQRDADRLLALLGQPGLFELLDQAAQDGVLPAPWQGGDFNAMPAPQAITLARQLLRASDQQSQATEPGLIPRLLERLRQEPTGLEAIADEVLSFHN